MAFKKAVIEDILKIEEIKDGFTNISYCIKTNKSEYFYQYFQSDKFNHKINGYKLNEFAFVPKVLHYSKQYMLTEFLKTKKLVINDKFLKNAARILHKMHNSNVKFPNSNIKKRMDDYHKQIKFKKDSIPLEIFNYQKLVYDFVKSQKIDAPCHNDPWYKNFLLSNNKFYLCDWEYATMNNRHFDLAFFITGSYLTKKQEAVFLKEYGEYDINKLNINKVIVYYLTLLWMHKFDKLPFDDKLIISELHKLVDNYS